MFFTPAGGKMAVQSRVSALVGGRLAVLKSSGNACRCVVVLVVLVVLLLLLLWAVVLLPGRAANFSAVVLLLV